MNDPYSMLQIARVIDSTEAEGPGRRLAVWVQGCVLRCEGCCNPEMFRSDGGTAIAAEELAARAVSLGATADIEGVSILGGEPFSQADAVAAMCEIVAAAGLTVMIYSGYTRSELNKQAENGAVGIQRLLEVTDLLVDGRFEKNQPETSRRWIGSKNQVLHFLSDRYRQDDPRFWTSNTVEIRIRDGQLIVNGWPQPADAVIGPLGRVGGGRARGPKR